MTRKRHVKYQSMRIHHKKQAVDAAPTQTANCLKCGKDFQSVDKRTNRICSGCTESNERSTPRSGTFHGFGGGGKFLG